MRTPIATLAVAFGASTLIVAGAAFAQGAPPAPQPPNATGEAVASQFPECTRQSSDADVEGAKGAHKAATQFFERGDYDRAIQYWRDAYGFDCSRPPLLLNIASAYEKKGDKAAAVAMLELFLTRAQDSPDGPTVREKIANLRAAMDAERAAAVPPPVEPPPPPPEPPPPPPAMERPHGIAPWVLVGVGGGVALIGVVPLVIGLGKTADAEAACSSRAGCAPEVADQGNTGRTLSLVGQIMIPVGLVAAGSGLVWQLGFNQERPVAGALAPPPSPRATLVPALGPGLQGAFVTGSF